MIVVTGATGNVGAHVVKELADTGAEVRALTRDPEAARFPDGVQAARTEDLPLEGATALFLHAAVVWQGADKLLERAKEAGVRRVVTLSSSSVLEDTDPQHNPIGALHRDLEAQVERTGLEWTHVRPGAFAVNAFQWAELSRPGTWCTARTPVKHDPHPRGRHGRRRRPCPPRRRPGRQDARADRAGVADLRRPGAHHRRGHRPAAAVRGDPGGGGAREDDRRVHDAGDRGLAAAGVRGHRGPAAADLAGGRADHGPSGADVRAVGGGPRGRLQL
ncbi:LOW QUALITY PROTEIN: NAD dependent epimerase/dehydratase, partial [Streptomyces himastatinicus ATCC 53653]